MRVPSFDLRAQMAEALSAASGELGPVPGLEVDVEVEPASYAHVFRYVSTTAWALDPHVLGTLKEIITARISGERLTDAEIEARIGAPIEARREAAARRRTAPVRRSGGAVALMSLYGLIAPRASMVESVSGPSGTGLDAFGRQFQTALDDPEVSSIVIDVNSPGGSVDMVPETAALIRRGREQKPVYAVANTNAGSAAYWLASQASRFNATPSGMVGSIGVYSPHTDISEAEAMKGRKTTLVSAGKYKTEGNPFGPLSEEAMAFRQSMVDGYYDWFLNDVAEGRDVKVADVRQGFGEGRYLPAQDALKGGMIDRLATLEETISEAMGGGVPSGPATGPSGEAPTLTSAEPVGPDELYIIDL